MEPVTTYPFGWAQSQNEDAVTREVLFEKIPFPIKLNPEGRRIDMTWYRTDIDKEFKVKNCTFAGEILKNIAENLHFSDFYVVMEGESKGRGILKIHRLRKETL